MEVIAPLQLAEKVTEFSEHILRARRKHGEITDAQRHAIHAAARQRSTLPKRSSAIAERSSLGRSLPSRISSTNSLRSKPPRASGAHLKDLRLRPRTFASSRDAGQLVAA